MRNLARPLALLALAASTCAPAQVSISVQMNKPEKAILGLPFSADQTVRSVLHLASGIAITREIKGHVYRSADGVERYDGVLTSTDPAHPDPATQVYILDRTKRTSILLNTRLKTATIQPLPADATVSIAFLPQQVPRLQNKLVKPENLTTADLGTKTQGMLELVGKRVTGSIPAGAVGNDQPLQVTAEVWFAPSLKLIVSQIDKNPLTGERTYELTNIRGDEPDPALFQIPDGYTIKERAPMPAFPPPLATPSGVRISEPPTKEIEAALNSPDLTVRNMAVAAEDTRNADIASGYEMELAGAGDAGASRVAASHAAMTVETLAAAAETAAAAVESDASQATAASAAGNRASLNQARDKAASEYSALLAADKQLAKAATDLVAAAAANAAFLGANPGTAAINDMGAQDSSAAANLLSAASAGPAAGYRAAAADETAAIKDAGIIANLDPTRAPALKAVAKAEAEAQSAAAAAGAGGSASAAAAAAAAAATVAASADGSGNPYAGAVESGAAAVANAASATLSAQHAMDGLKALK